MYKVTNNYTLHRYFNKHPVLRAFLPIEIEFLLSVFNTQMIYDNPQYGTD